MTYLRKTSSLALALLAATMLTPPGPARAAPGDALGPEFQVNGFTTGLQWWPAVAMDADGDFVVAWESGDGSLSGVFAQRFDAAGVAQGPEFQVNTFTTNSQDSPAVAMDADGDFVVAWTDSGGQDGSQFGVFAQRYNAAGVAQGDEFQVNTFTTGGQGLPAVAMDADGDFVVAWQSGDGSLSGVFAQRFDAAGVAQGPEFQVNTFTTNHQRAPAVAMDADGDFVVAWQSDGQDGDFIGVFAQRYNASGAAQGTEFQVNTFTTDLQMQPVVAMDADGDFVVAWHSGSQDGSDYGVFAQRFDGVERIEADFDGDGNADVLWRRTDNGNTSLWLMEGTTRLAAVPIGNPGTVWQVAGTGDFNGDAKTDVLWRRSDNGNISIWLMDGASPLDKGPVVNPGTVWAIEALRDTNGDGLSDIVWRHSGNGKSAVWEMNGFTRVDKAEVGTAGTVWQVQ